MKILKKSLFRYDFNKMIYSLKVEKGKKLMK